MADNGSREHKDSGIAGIEPAASEAVGGQYGEWALASNSRPLRCRGRR
ncbi:MAG: hypothetical protein ACQES8_03320 [Thermodesulfobacteriota bacterium]